MYNHLCGKICAVTPAKIILEVNGIGWELCAPLSTTNKLKAGGEITVLTHLVVREDALMLYAFYTEAERALFRKLIGLSGIGASTAVQILSSTTPNDFLLAIEKQDANFLQKIKGIGEKTAKRIILELKGAKTTLPDRQAINSLGGVAADAVIALETLGIPNKEAVIRVEKALSKDAKMSLEMIVAMALQG